MAVSAAFNLHIIIVNWNVCDLLRACLSSVYADLARCGLESGVWVVDNASHDDSAQMVHAEFPQAHVISSPENLGFAGGNNLALRQVLPHEPEYILLLNPDTEVQPGALPALVEFMLKTPQAGVAGAQLLYADGRFQHGAFDFPGLWQIMIDLLPAPTRLHESWLNGRYPQAVYQAGQPFSIGHPLGAVMLVRRQVIDKVGMFDPDFYMYCEEIDWCWRIQRAGWGVYCVPQARVIHHAGQSTGQVKTESFVNLWRSRKRLYAKHYHPLKRQMAQRLVRLGMRWQKTAAQRQAKRGRMDIEQCMALTQAIESILHFF